MTLMSRFQWTLLMLTGLVLFQAGPLGASTFQVNPIRLFFSEGKMSDIVTVKNESKEALRFQVTVTAWAQREDGEMDVTPSSDLVAFPKLFTLKPGEERKIRVGGLVKPSGVEKTYRVFFEELRTDAAQPGNSIRILTKMGVPVFVQPAKAAGQPAFEGATVSGGKLSFSVVDKGNAHFLLHNVAIEALDAEGRSLGDRKMDAWYVLAGGRRSFATDLPAESCAKIERIRLTGQTDLPGDLAAFTTTIAVPASARCSH
jgi:fimbrial chaperone protein